MALARNFYRLLAVLVICIFSFSQISFAQEQDEVLKKGIYQFRQESYDEAIDSFDKVLSEKPDSSLAAYYKGLTYKRMENYVEGRKWLEKSLNMRPKIKGALIELVDLLYRLKEYDEAKKWITIAEDEGIRPAQAKFLKGLTLQKNGEYRESIEAFRDAADLDERLKQSVEYQIGVCYLNLKEYDKAIDAFNEVITIDPQSEVAGYADKYIGVLDKKLERLNPYHLSLKAAFDYDSNVVLRPDDTSLVSGISDQDDTRQTYTAKADYTLRPDDSPLSLKLGYDFGLAKQTDIGAYDTISNKVYAQGNVSLETVLLTFPVSFNHLIVDDNNYLATYSVGNINNVRVGSSQLVQAGIIYNHDDYLKKPVLSDENRTGNEVTATAGWFNFFMGNEAFWSLRYSFVKEWTKGDNWDSWGNKMSAGILVPFLDKFKVSVNGQVFLQYFDKTHSVFNKKREDQVYSIGSFLSYEITDNIELQVQYTYINDRSNISIYKYDRHVVSTGIQYNF